MMIPKFRAWWIQDEVMTHIDTLEFLQGGIRVSDGCWHEKFLGDEVILMQYTGLKDKNGVEIYEGDVLFHPLQGRRKVFYPYSKTVASYGLRNIDNGFGSTLQDSHAVWEVIGNIHESPELLSSGIE